MLGGIRHAAGRLRRVPRGDAGEPTATDVPALAGTQRSRHDEAVKLDGGRVGRMAVAPKSLEAFLIAQGTVSEETLEKAHERQRDGKGLGDVLQEMGAIDSGTWARALADHFGLPFNDRLPEDGGILELINTLPINFAKRCQ